MKGYPELLQLFLIHLPAGDERLRFPRQVVRFRREVWVGCVCVWVGGGGGFSLLALQTGDLVVGKCCFVSWGRAEDERHLPAISPAVTVAQASFLCLRRPEQALSFQPGAMFL